MEATARARKPAESKRERIKEHRGPRYAYKAGVFLLGLVIILACLALWTVLPAPLAIPPMLVGLWIWATEFSWAEGPLKTAKSAGERARKKAKERPVVFALVTVVGLIVAGAGYWAFMHFLL
jgi:multisubunit Na+/H+ antiporter MnhB subunit